MRTIDNFSDANEALKEFIPTTTLVGNYTLDTMKSLMKYLGDPQNRLKVIHVAGTSGKTSTSYYLSSLLTAAGYTTGLTVSPQVDELNERTQINTVPMPEREYCKNLSEFLDLVDDSGLQPSHFEILVAFAYWVFHKQQVDYAVVEVGLGGLLDGTNVVDRTDKLCVITDIGMDHTDVLGDTLGEIAAQKAGIVHSGNEVFMYEQSKEVMEVVQRTIQTNNAQLNIAKTLRIESIDDLPTFQQRNFGLALGVVEFISHRDGHKVLTSLQIQKASDIYIPGRMEVVTYKGKTLVMDGAHNEQKIGALVPAMKKQFPDQDITMLVSFGQNKLDSVRDSLKLLRQLGSSIIITSFYHGQDEIRKSIDLGELAGYAKEAGFSVVTESNSLTALELLTSADTEVGLIVGSFYLLEDLWQSVLGK